MPRLPPPFQVQPMRQRPELSRRQPLSTLGKQDAGGRPAAAQEIIVEATAEEFAPLARRLGVPAVLALRCRFRLAGVDAAGRVAADGRLTATLRRVCVASLEEFDDEVVEAFRVRFVPASPGVGEDDSLDPDSDDDLPYEGIQIDLGEAAVEQLALAMQPYPRKPGATLPDGIGSVDAAPVEANAGPGAGAGGGDADGDAARGAAGGTAGGADGEAGKPNPFAVLKARLPR